MRDRGVDQLQRAADAFTAALVRHNILSWTGIGDSDETPVEPSHDREIVDGAGKLERIEPGTISAFLCEPRLVEACDREYVLPWTKLDAEKNGLSASVSGTTAAETPAGNIASSAAVTPRKAAAVTKRPARPRAPTKSTLAKPKKARRSGN